jgi:ankyrin repeat protein
MDTLPLPPRPDIEQYRKRAKLLVDAANSADPDAVTQWATDWLKALTRLLDVEITPFVQGSFDRAVGRLTEEVTTRKNKARDASGKFALSDAQHLIAQAHSYENWASLAAEIESLRTVSRSSMFERAADAVVTGDLATLDELLLKNPGLIREHSSRTHHATLLHYVAANGVEDFRQKTPPNAVGVAERLLAAGADVNALADTYGKDLYQTTMNLLVSSMHPAEAGLQSALVEVLLNHGAAIDGLENNGSPILTALAFGYRDAADTLARRGAAISHVVIAAAVGRLDLVQRWVLDPNTLAKDHGPYVGPYWVHIPDDTTGQIELALAWACKFGRDAVAMYLLDLGVSARAQDNDRMTALHWASARGMLDVMERLIVKGAELEATNTWGGTVVDSAAWFAANSPMPGVDYPDVIDQLLAAGADVNHIYPPLTGIPAVDDVIRRYRDA